MKYLYPIAAIALLFAIAAYSFLTTRDTLGSYCSDLSQRTESQIRNIQQGARALDGFIVKPGEVFSFNRVVGPRTLERGYQPAPSYLENLITDTVGGGICQLSSTLYAASLEAGVVILQRVPHRYLVHSVAPGRDATVWYGKADLQWMNNTPVPIRIEARIQGTQLIVTLKGRLSRKVQVSTRRIGAPRPGVACFQTLRQVGESQWATLDVYLER
jgi:vancomycin resistance protein YoaR